MTAASGNGPCACQTDPNSVPLKAPAARVFSKKKGASETENLSGVAPRNSKRMLVCLLAEVAAGPAPHRTSPVPLPLHMRATLWCFVPEALHSTGRAALLAESWGSIPECLLLEPFCRAGSEDERGICGACSREGVAKRLGLCGKLAAEGSPRSSAMAETDGMTLAWDRVFGVAGTIKGPRGCV